MNDLERLVNEHPDLKVVILPLPNRQFFACLMNDGGDICSARGDSFEGALTKLELEAVRAFAPEVSPC